MSFTDETAKQPKPTTAAQTRPTAMEATLGESPTVPTKSPEAPRRPDVLGSDKWHETAKQQYPESRFFTDASGDHASIKASLDALDNLYTTRDPRVTPAAHAERVTKQAEQAAERIETRIRRTVDRNAEAIRTHRAVMFDRLKISEDSSHGKEIRERLARMENDERRQAILKATQEGDHHVMAAVLHGPGFLTGISEDEKNRFREAYARKHQPQLMQELDAMQRSADKLEAAHFEAVDHIRRHYVNRQADPEISKATEAERRYQSVLNGL